VVSGIVKQETAAAIKVAMMGGIEFNLSVPEIAKREVSKYSTMPEGLFDALQPDQVIDLVKYLQSQGKSDSVASERVLGAIEAESLKAKPTSGSVRPQQMSGFGAQWSGGSQLWWTGAKPGDSLTLTFRVQDAGRYRLLAALTRAHDYGIIKAELNGQVVVAHWDGYTAGKVEHSGELDWGLHALSAGDQTLTLTITGRHPDATPRHMAGMDYLRLEKQ
jgi:hypothetical protein